MPKTYGYPDFTDENAYVKVIDGGVDYRVRLDNLIGSAISDRGYAGFYSFDYLSRVSLIGSFPYPWQLTAVGAGTLSPAPPASSENHPGVGGFAQNGANTGGSIWLGFASNLLIAGEEEAEFIVNFPLIASSNVVYMGFSDNFTGVATPVDGVYLVLNTLGQIAGVTFNNSVSSSTATTYSVTANTWYHGRIKVNAAASQVDFYWYDDSGNLLWSDSITTNIPTAVGRELSYGIRAFKTTAGTDDLIYIDYLSLFLPKALTR